MISQRQLLAVVVAVAVVTTQFAGAAAALPLTDGTTLQQQEASVDGVQQPTWIVEFENDSADSLEAWTESNDARLLSVDNDSRTAVVAASSKAFGDTLLASVLGSGLANKAYITDAEPNYQLSRTDPVSLANESDVEAPSSLRANARSLVPGQDADWSADGVAFSEDANETTMAESRSVLGVDNVSEKGDGMTVAVIDTGANTADGQLFGNSSSGSDLRILNASKNFITNETVGDNGTDAIADGSGHGTWVASSIAGDHSNDTHDGVAPNASLLVLKALADDGSGATSDITSAIRYAADQNADVISLSLGSPIYSDELEDAIAYARAEGSVVVVAAGNSARSQPVGVASPADVDGAIGVAATTGEPAANASVAYFSQRSGQVAGDGHWATEESVDVAAPGFETTAMTVTESGRMETDTLSGTSMATPMVAGSIALALEANPSWDVNKTTEMVSSTARRMNNTAVAEVGAGMVAADHLVSATNTSLSQEEAMDEPAQGRQGLYESIAASTGGTWARVSRSVQSVA